MRGRESTRSAVPNARIQRLDRAPLDLAVYRGALQPGVVYPQRLLHARPGLMPRDAPTARGKACKPSLVGTNRKVANRVL